MKYRLAGEDDLDACAECIAECGYFDEVDLRERGGSVLLAEDEGGIQAVVWAIAGGKIAYTDLLSVRPKFQRTGVGTRLVLYGLRVLKAVGVTEVRSFVHLDNPQSLRLMDSMGALEGPYMMSIVNLEGLSHGQEND